MRQRYVEIFNPSTRTGSPADLDEAVALLEGVDDRRARVLLSRVLTNVAIDESRTGGGGARRPRDCPRREAGDDAALAVALTVETWRVADDEDQDAERRALSNAPSLCDWTPPCAPMRARLTQCWVSSAASMRPSSSARGTMRRSCAPESSAVLERRSRTPSRASCSRPGDPRHRSFRATRPTADEPGLGGLQFACSRPTTCGTTVRANAMICS